MTILDLIELQNLRPVIQLGNKDDESEALASFVWTENLSHTLDDFHSRCEAGQGGGIFLKGHYGTGKSHLLSYLSQTSANGFGKLHTQVRYKAFTLSLIRHSASQTLEDITLTQFGIERLEHEDRDFYFKRVLEELSQQNYQGFMILYDELSEFLKSKPNAAALSEDLRFLQFIAEFSNHHQCWVIAAIQEEIEGIGHASRETSLKLKDRFALRWNLSTLHVEDLLSGRLLHKREGATAKIETLFQQFHQLWPKSFSRLSTFVKIYPLHPGTLDFLMGLGSLFSEHRGVLRFVLENLRGFGPTDQQPHLNAKADQLLCADRIFDYFSERLQENLELKSYYQKVWLHLEARVQTLIEEHDRDLTKRCLKIIILANLDPRREGIEIEELTALCMFKLGEQAELAHAYLRDELLGKLIGRVNYLSMEEQRYRIQLHHLEYELLDKLLEQRMSELDLKQLRVWEALLPLMDRPPMDFATFWKNPASLNTINWLNTPRHLSLSWTPESSQADLRIALPLQKMSPSNNSQLSLCPRDPSPTEAQTLLRAAALILLGNIEAPTQVEQQAKLEAQKQIKHQHQEWRQILEQCYRDGAWYLGDKKIHLNSMWDHSGGFESNLEDPVYELFSQRHPRFRDIAPKLEYYNERSLNDLIENFVKVEKVSEASLKQMRLLELVTGLAKPLGLAIKDQQSYRFCYEPNHHAFLMELQQLLNQHHGQLSPCREQLQKGAYGLPPLLFDFIIWSLVEVGLFNAYRDHEPIAAGKLSFYNLKTITHLQTIETLSQEEFSTLHQFIFFKDADHSLSSHGLQQHLWSYFLNQFQNIKNLIEKYKDLETQNAWSFCHGGFKEMQALLLNIEQNIELNPKESLLGLRALIVLKAPLQRWHEMKPWLTDLQACYKKHHHALPELLTYLKDEFHDSCSKIKAWQGLEQERQNLLSVEKKIYNHDSPWALLDEWIKNIESWKQHHCELYRQFHQRDCTIVQLPAKTEFIKLLNQSGLQTDIATVQVCQRDQTLELKHLPFCRCGYVPKEEALVVDDHQLKDTIINFVQSSLIDAELKANLTAAIQQNDYPQALELWKSISQKPRLKVQKISIKQFEQKYRGKTMSRQELMLNFENWLKTWSENQSFELDD